MPFLCVIAVSCYSAAYTSLKKKKEDKGKQKNRNLISFSLTAHHLSTVSFLNPNASTTFCAPIKGKVVKDKNNFTNK